MKLFESDDLWKIRAQFAWFVLWAGCTGVGIFLHASSHGHGTHQQLGLPPCPSVLLFSRPCPGCGLTTSWTAFIHGDLLTSFKAHPLGPVMYLGFTFVGLGTLYGNVVKKRMLIDTDWASRIFVIFVSIFFVFGFVRMALTTQYAATPKEIYWRGGR
jgi:hypothetical protein